MKQLYLAPVDLVHVGDELLSDNGFTCMVEGAKCKVEKDDDGLFVRCNEGRHYLNGQEDDHGNYVGFLNLTRDTAY